MERLTGELAGVAAGEGLLGLRIAVGGGLGCCGQDPGGDAVIGDEAVVVEPRRGVGVGHGHGQGRTHLQKKRGRDSCLTKMPESSGHISKMFNSVT